MSRGQLQRKPTSPPCDSWDRAIARTHFHEAGPIALSPSAACARSLAISRGTVQRAATPVKTRIAEIGLPDPSCRKLTTADPTAAVPTWTNPDSDEATPAAWPTSSIVAAPPTDSATPKARPNKAKQ